ncbi:MAG: 3-dehydroquinate synthase, partial [Ferrovibrio sp.]
MSDTSEVRTVRVDLGQRAYDIKVGGGLLEQAGEHIAPLLRRPFAVIVTDENVAARHLDTLKRALALKNIGCEAVVLPAGEKLKSYAGFEQICEALLALKVERRDH